MMLDIEKIKLLKEQFEGIIDADIERLKEQRDSTQLGESSVSQGLSLDRSTTFMEDSQSQFNN